MSGLILITKPDCERCEWVKSKIPEGMDLEIVNGTSREGMAYLAYYELLDESYPFLINYDEDWAVVGTIKIKQKLHSILENNGGNHEEPKVEEIKEDG